MNYKLVWSEEFESNSPTKLKTIACDIAGDGFGNNESQYYTDRPENIRIDNNKLVITGRKEVYKHCHYTSAKISTKGIKSFRYGKLAISAKLPKGAGTWPAIWMMPDAHEVGITWPDCGEIDILEHIGRKEQQIHFSLHTALYNHKNNNQYTAIREQADINDRFIEYGIIWTKESISFLVDEELVATFKKGEEGKVSNFNGWPFDQSFYLIINLALGGYWGGDIDDTCLPASLEIDYIRYFQEVK